MVGMNVPLGCIMALHYCKIFLPYFYTVKKNHHSSKHWKEFGKIESIQVVVLSFASTPLALFALTPLAPIIQTFSFLFFQI